MFVNNIFGMSETAGPMTTAFPDNYKNYNLKSCGEGVRGGEIMIMTPDTEGNGEVCFRARNCFMGYFKNEQATRETIDDRRYVHSGDLGKFDDRGNLMITGRLKE